MAKYKVKKESIVWRIIITCVGIICILWAINNVGLALFGKTAKATVKTSRYNNGYESNQPVNKQYKWSVSWTFEVDGKEYSGTSTVRGSAISVKHGSTVYYYSFVPQINSLYAKDGLGFGTVILITIGVLLIVFMNKKPKKKTYNRKKNTQNNTKQETVKQDIIKQEAAKQETVKQENVKQENVKHEEKKMNTTNDSQQDNNKPHFCGNCGSKIIGKGKFCENCGAKITE